MSLSILVVLLIWVPIEVTSQTCDCFDVQEMIQTAARNAVQDKINEEHILKDIRRVFNEEFVFSLNASFEKNFLKPGDEPDNAITSCQELTERNIKYDSKEYWIKPTEDSEPLQVYCNMDVTCGGVEGGWRRVGILDMTDSTQDCPSEFTEITTDDGKRLCGGDSNGCFSVTFDTKGIEYNSVCGRVIAYQSGHPGAFHNSWYGVWGPYVEGVSITRGGYSYEHIWTLAAASDDSDQGHTSKCPCIHKDFPEHNYLIPYFVNNDYFCDTALTSINTDSYGANDVITDKPLWDGEDCGADNSCCQFPGEDVNPPWFYKAIEGGTQDDIEVRLCQGSRQLGSTPIELIELYVQ